MFVQRTIYGWFVRQKQAAQLAAPIKRDAAPR
jgi:hypothetical protein